MDKNEPKLFASKEELEEQALKTAQKAAKELSQSVYLYYIARYFVSLYEARFGEIPLQVWNDYRNALDHYFRHITSAGSSSHIEKMERHLQRAVLDIAKIFCHDADKKIRTLIDAEDIHCLRLVDNGTFYTNLSTGLNAAEANFALAKVSDSALGDNASNDREVLSLYLNACYSYISTEGLFSSRREAIEEVSHRTTQLTDNAVKGAQRHAFKEHVFASLTAKIIAGVALLAFGYLLAIVKPLIVSAGETDPQPTVQDSLAPSPNFQDHQVDTEASQKMDGESSMIDSPDNLSIKSQPEHPNGQPPKG